MGSNHQFAGAPLHGQVVEHRFVFAGYVLKLVGAGTQRVVQSAAPTNDQEILALDFEMFKCVRMASDEETAFFGLISAELRQIGGYFPFFEKRFFRFRKGIRLRNSHCTLSHRPFGLTGALSLQPGL